jgi:4-hydroxy-3-methylbut-2-enyl diphosphate reductase
MLATETQEISDYLRQVMLAVHGDGNIKNHIADTRDTLCYATNDNQSATYGLMEEKADLAIVIGGYNSSNTTHLVELLETKFPTFFIKSQEEITSISSINSFNIHSNKLEENIPFITNINRSMRVIITSGASCPDSIVDGVLQRLLSYFPDTQPIDSVLKSFQP